MQQIAEQAANCRRSLQLQCKSFTESPEVVSCCEQSGNGIVCKRSSPIGGAGFNGSLLIGEEVFDPTVAVPVGGMTAELASHQSFQYQTYLLAFDWLRQELITRIMVGAGKTKSA